MKSKKIFTNRTKVILLALLLIFSTVVTVYAKELKAETSETKLYLNGSLIDKKIMIVDEENYLPIDIANIFGASVHINENTNSINLISHTSMYKTYDEQYFATGEYTGTVKFTYDNGTVYIGGFKNGNFHGKGKIVYANGTKYEGNFVEGELEGFGKYTALNGDTYSGYFEDNDYDGYATYTYANGDKVCGVFKGNEIEGTVHVIYKAERITKNLEEWNEVIQKVDIYDETFNPYLYNGTANIVYINGTTYDGALAYSKYNGKGKIEYPDGSIYSGNWVKNHKTGYGVYTFPNGEQYKGYFSKDKFDGVGSFYYKNGDKYEGLWKNNLQDGKGKMTYANGNVFVGAWEDGKKHTIDYKGGYSKYEEDYGKYTISKKNIYKKNTSYSKIKDEVYYQKWDNGKLVREREKED